MDLTNRSTLLAGAGSGIGRAPELNRRDPAAVDRMLAEGKAEPEKVVAGHSSL